MSGAPKDDAAKMDAIESFLADQIINESDQEALAAVSADDLRAAQEAHLAAAYKRLQARGEV